MTAQVRYGWVCQRKQVNTQLYLTCIPLMYFSSIGYLNISCSGVLVSAKKNGAHPDFYLISLETNSLIK